ncbi:hypothetical protein L9F63_001610, partial [Diploptera punctata]
MDIYRISKPIYILSKLFGLIGYVTVHGKSYKISKFCLMYGNPRTGFYYDTMFLILSIFLCVVMVLQIICLINNKRIITIYNRIQQYDSMLNEFPRNLFSWFMYSNAIGMIWCVYSQFLFLVAMLRQRFQHLNKTLQEPLRNSFNKMASTYTLGLHSQRKPKFASDKHLRNVGKLHNMLCEILEYTNTTYSVIFLLIVALSCFEITWMGYDLVMMFIVNFQDENMAYYNRHPVSVTFLNIAMYLIKIITSVICGQTATEKLSFHLLQLDLFSLQLAQRKSASRPKLNKSNYCVLFQIAGAVTTYLIILVQFQLSEYNKDIPTVSPASTPLIATNITSDNE